MKLEVISGNLDRELAQYIDALNRAELYREVGEIILESVDANFMVGGRFGSFFEGRWQGGTQRWKKSKRAERDGGLTLVDTSRLRNSVTYFATSDGITVFTNVSYGYKHQFGVNTPARPFIVLQAQDLIAIQEAAEGWLRRQFRL